MRTILPAERARECIRPLTPAGLMTVLLWRRLLRIDPALERTYAAGRVTVAVALAIGGSFLIIRAGNQPVALVMVAVFVALQMSLRPSETRWKQVRVDLLSWLCAAGAIMLGVILLPSPLAAAGGFVALMSAATWASGYGPAGLTVGIVSFVSYLFTQFAHPRPADLPWLLLAVTVGVASACIVRHLLLPDRPRRMLGWLIAALRDEATDLTTRRRPPDADVWVAGLHRSTAETIDAILLRLHDLLDAHPDLVVDERQFRRDLFAVVTLSHLLVLQAERAAADDDDVLLPPPETPEHRLELYLSAIEAEVQGRTVLQGDRDAALEGERALEAAREKLEPEASLEEGWFAGHRRRALQVAVAGVLAVLAGFALSPDRWYWAPMTSFFVFANANSRGATLRRAIERTAGTIGGVAGGLLLGSVLAGQPRLQLLAVFPLLFAGFWLLPVSYALMTVMITCLLALLYSMMAIFTLDLLLLRLGETAIGAAIGALVAYVLLPARTRSAVEDVTREFFAALAVFLEALPAAVRGEVADDAWVLETVRRLDRATASLGTTINPLSEAVPGRRASALRQELILTLTARYWAHRIAARALFHEGEAEQAELDRALTSVRTRLDNLRAGGAPMEPPRRPDHARTPLEAAVLRLETVLASISRVRAGRM